MEKKKDLKENNKKTRIKINILRVILIVLLMCTFGIIFGFSNQNGKTSGSLSRKITEAITSKAKSIQEMEKSERELILKRIEGIIRKIAHFSIYAIVGILLVSLFSTYKIEEFDRIAYSLIIGVIYAITDEIHQAFTPERGPSLFDVILDGEGVLFGICLVLICIKIYKRENKKTITEK